MGSTPVRSVDFARDPQCGPTSQKAPRPDLLGALPETVLDRRPSVPAGDEIALLALVARLPEQERVVVLLRYLDEMPVGQIARVLALPVGTVTKQLSRARERLRRQIKCEESPCGRIRLI